MNLPLVSIIIITYNQYTYLEETIISALNQDYPNIEIIISDDCSTDGTVQIINRYATQYSQKIIPLFNSTNLGITANLNQAVGKTNGKYIALLGGDDIMFPDKIASQVKAFLDHPTAVICYNNVEVFASTTNDVLYNFHDVPNGGHYPHVGSITEQLIKYRCFFCNGCSSMILKSAIPPEIFDIRLPTASDWLMFIRVSMQGSAVYVDKILGRYRRHQNNITKKINNSHQEELVYQILLKEYPQYKTAIVKGQSRLHLFFTMKYLLNKNFREAIQSLKKFVFIVFHYPHHTIGFIVKSIFIDGYFALKRSFNNNK